MNDFRVEVVEVDEVLEHPNADRLEIAKVKGWQCVVGKDSFAAGDKGIYIPIESILPEELEAKIFGTSKVKLSKHRVKTIRLRGAVSQGLLVPPKTLTFLESPVGTDLTDTLGITRYEPPAPKFQQGPTGSAKKRDIHPDFHKYTKWFNINNYNQLFKDEDVVIATEKIHGCLRADTKVTLWDGTKLSIKEIVENKLDVDLLGFDSENNPVKTKILNHFNNGITDEWSKLKLTKVLGVKGNHYKTINCTPNHKFYNHTKHEYMACENLSSGDTVSSSIIVKEPNYIQKSVLLGKMLGDGCLSNGGVEFRHKKEHEKYVDYTLRSLGDLAGSKQKEQLSGYGTIMCPARTIKNRGIVDLLTPFLKGNEKQVPVISLDAISLAFWYMDDGSLSHSDKQKDRASFATCSFNENSVNNLIDAFDKLGIKAVKQFSDKYWRIRLNTKEAYKMFDLIYPFVPAIMRYKLPKEYRGKPFSGVPLSISTKSIVLQEQKVISIEKTDISKVNKTKYDLETGTHNFIADDIIVHNSNFRAGWLKFKPRTLWQKFKAMLGLGKQWEFVYGSHNVQLNRKFLYSGYYASNVYAKAVHKYNLKEVIPKSTVVYGEIYGDGIQKGYTYGCEQEEQKLAVFDITVNGEYLGREEFLTEAMCMKLTSAPVLFMGKFCDFDFTKIMKGPSTVHPSQLIKEGCVLKPVREEKSYIGRKGLKCINPEYLLRKGNTDYH